MRFALGLLTVLLTGLFAGGALYVSLAEHPARIEAGSAVALAHFGPSYRRAARWQGTWAVGALLAGLGAAWLSGSWPWALAGVLTGAAIPLTLLVIAPVNRRLMSCDLPPAGDEAARLLSRWARLHAGRGVLGLAGFAVAAAEALAG